MAKISAVVITYNEADKIEQALASLREVCDELLVVDSFSSDETPVICRSRADRVIQRAWPGYREQKQFATREAAHDWVLSLDADEVLSPELQEELGGIKERLDHGKSGYYMPRKTFFLGRWIEHTCWYPDWQLRLFHRAAGSWQGGRVHESFRVEGPTARLSGHILHYTYSSITEYLDQLQRFSSLAAADAFEAGRRTGPLRLLAHPAASFFKNYLLRTGFLDGVPGLVVSCLAAVSTFFKHLKLLEMQVRGPGR